jgi:crotonobetainyl-CoA:carnitine CoA-transferase CaiB-like acyl-CoA transferase
VLAELTAQPRQAWRPATDASNGASSSGGVLPNGPLDGVTVLEFATIIATPLGSSLIGDLGARVIKVEPIGGDPYRGMGIGIAAAKTNVSKESIALNLKSEDAQRVLRDLIERADVIVHNYRPGVPERLGMGYEQARAINPRIVHISANGYGPRGPGAHRPSTHPIPGAGMGGATWQAGEGMPPGYCETIEEVREVSRLLMRSNEVNPDPNTSAVIASAALLGLYARDRHGVGQQIFVNMLGANSYANSDDFLTYEGKRPRPTIDRDLYGHGALYRLYECAEGWVFLGVVTDGEWAALVAHAGSTEVEDERFATPGGRKQHDTDLASALETLFQRKTADEWERELTPLGVGCVRADGPMPGEFWLEDPHVRENGFVVERHHARYGDYLRHGPLQLLHDTPGALGPAVLAGEHTDAILAELGYDEEAIATLRANGNVWSEQVEVEYSGFF